MEELATTQERNRVARDFHDGLGHHLTVVQMQVQAARAVLGWDPAKADAVLAKAQQQSTEALAEVRRSVAALREPRVVPPLPQALEALADDTSGAGIPTEVHVTGTARPLAAEAEESLFRAAQAGLTVEMVVAMLVGMMVVDLVWPSGTARADVGVMVMATNMAIGRGAWMRFRGHSWRRIADMSAAMYLPFLVLRIPFRADLTGEYAMTAWGHVLMLGDGGVMLLRPDEYAH